MQEKVKLEHIRNLHAVSAFLKVKKYFLLQCIAEKKQTKNNSNNKQTVIELLILRSAPA